MLYLTIKGDEVWDEEKECFIPPREPITIALEHSLRSISKWEGKWKKSFLGNGILKVQHTPEQLFDYVKCMTVTKNVPDDVYSRITEEQMTQIQEYMNENFTATHFSENGPPRGGRLTHESRTADLIYYEMTALNIPFECDRWHISRLLTLITVCSLKQQDPKKKSRTRIMTENQALNEARLKKLGTKG